MRALLEDMRSGEVSAHDVPAPQIQAGGILVRTAFSAISAGTERVKVEAGRKSLFSKAMARPDLVKQTLQYARSNGIRAAHQKVQAQLDTLSALGYSCSGYVLESGAGVTEFKPGDRVACAGGGYANHCEINFVPRNLAVRVPGNVSLEAAALTTIGAIAMQGVRQAGIAVGETVAVIGVGLVGILSIQILRAAGCRVVAIDRSRERVSRAIDLGAHLALCTDDPRLEGAVTTFSRYGVDAALITAATRSADPMELAAKLLRDRGRIVVVGDVGMGVSRAAMYMKEVSLSMSRSYGPGRYDPQYEEEGQDYPVGFVRWTEKRNMEAFLDLLAAGMLNVEPLLEHRFPVEEGGKAYAALETGIYTGIIDYHAPPDSQIPDECYVAPRPAQRPMGKLRVGCVGAGGFARGVTFPHLCASSELILESVATSSGVTAESARKLFGFRIAQTPSELLSDPNVDATFILTRHDSHAAYVTTAIEQGKPAFVEKPLAVDRDQLDMVRAAYTKELAENKSPFLMVGFNRRFSPLTEKLKNFFAHRSAPMLVHIRCNGGFIPRSSWIQSRENGGRIIGELCHFVDWARAVVQRPIETITAAALPDAGSYNQDNVTVTISFQDGSLANLLYLANGDRAVAKEYFEVFCEGSIARIDDFKTLYLSHNGKTKVFKGGGDKGHRREIELTLEAMKQRKEAPISFAELLEVTEATFAVEEAIRTRRTVSLLQRTEDIGPARDGLRIAQDVIRG
jgi:predicted dehydrogenase/threonine dehydrogenase-like Zn-dependent dehydrogenase